MIFFAGENNVGGEIGSDEGDDSAYEEVTPTTAGDTTSTAMVSVFTRPSGDAVAPGREDVFGYPPLEGVAKEAWLPDAGKIMLLLDGPLEESPAASLPPATVAPGIVDGPTSDDGGKSLHAATKTAKVKWKRQVVVVKFHFASLVV